MKVVLLGDTHGNAHALVDAFFVAKDAEAEAIIQLGDFGFGWIAHTGQCEFSRLAAEMVERTAIPFYWLDGNHENFDLLYEIEPDENNHRHIFPGVTHLGRGSTLTIGDTTFMAFGGAISVDRQHRVLGRSYWQQESVTPEDIEAVKSNTTPIDIFLSHDAPYGAQTDGNYRWLAKTFGEMAKDESVVNQKLVREALDLSEAKQAYHGHLHLLYRAKLDNGVTVTGIAHDGSKENTLLLDNTSVQS